MLFPGLINETDPIINVLKWLTFGGNNQENSHATYQNDITQSNIEGDKIKIVDALLGRIINMYEWVQFVWNWSWYCADVDVPQAKRLGLNDFGSDFTQKLGTEK